MAIARKLLVDTTKLVVVHCVFRCVQHEFLIELEDRRRSRMNIMDRMRPLAMYSVVDALEAAVFIEPHAFRRGDAR